ncbi:MAG TPA: GNAT family N-acetyltransferase [Usitatibacter sp.]|jgi:putative acetyltransferase|nr:GNAT family N-acetyltransferase [Usitatibacter sp.]
MDIVIRRAEPRDYESIWRTFQDEGVYSGTLQTPFVSQERWMKILSEGADSNYILLACCGDEVLGHGGLHPIGKAARRAHAMGLGLVVRDAWQGKGVGNALMAALVDLADNWLPVIRLELTVYTDNERAIALYRKFGFEMEGTHRCYALRAGRYIDAYAMARLKSKPVAV